MADIKSLLKGNAIVPLRPVKIEEAGEKQRRHLIDYAKEFGNEEPVFAEFGSLQRLSFTYLQNKLAVIKGQQSENGTMSEEELTTLSATMHSYGMLES